MINSMQEVSACGSLLCSGHALAHCPGVAHPSLTLCTAVQTSCAHRMIGECDQFPCGSFEPQLPAWGRAGTSSEAAWRARCAVEQPMRLGPHLPLIWHCHVSAHVLVTGTPPVCQIQLSRRLGRWFKGTHQARRQQFQPWCKCGL